MSDVVWQAVIAAVVTIILALIQLVTNIKLNKLTENVEVVRHATNSMKDALVAAALKTGKLEGAETERQDEKQRQDDAKGSEADPIHVKLKEDALPPKNEP